LKLLSLGQTITNVLPTVDQISETTHVVPNEEWSFLNILESVIPILRLSCLNRQPAASVGYHDFCQRHIHAVWSGPV